MMRLAAYGVWWKLFLFLLPVCVSSSFVFSENPQNNIKIVSLSPCLTEIIFKLGRGGAMVGRSSACDYPEDVKKIPVAGRMGVPFLETFATHKTDIVVAASLVDTSMEKTIREMGIKFLMLPTDSIDDYFNAVEKLGRELDCEDTAATEIRRVKDGLVKFQSDSASTAERPSVYIEIWSNPVMTAGRRSFINDCITYAGGRNIAGDIDKEYFACSMEWVVSSNPQIIIAPVMGKNRISEIPRREGWANVPAVRNNRIYVGLNSNLIFRLGPRILESIELFRNCIHPDASK